MRVLSLLASVSPAPQAVIPSPSNPAVAMAPNLVISFIWLSLTFVVGFDFWYLSFLRVTSGSSPRRPDVDGDRGDDQHTLDDVLPVGGHDEDVQPVVQGLDDEQ